MADKIQCDHGYVLMQDSCPGCDAMSETKHEPRMVRVMGFKGRAVRRCTACGEPASHPSHKVRLRTRRRAVNTNRQGANFELAVMAELEKFGYTCLRSSGSRGAVDVVAVPAEGRRYDWVIFIQAKISKAIIPPAERVALMGLALRAGALPVVAYKGEEGRSRPILFRELTGPGPFEFREWTPTTEENEG